MVNFNRTPTSSGFQTTFKCLKLPFSFKRLITNNHIKFLMDRPLHREGMLHFKCNTDVSFLDWKHQQMHVYRKIYTGLYRIIYFVIKFNYYFVVYSMYSWGSYQNFCMMLQFRHFFFLQITQHFENYVLFTNSTKCATYAVLRKERCCTKNLATFGTLVNLTLTIVF